MKKWKNFGNYIGENYDGHYILCSYSPVSSISEIANFIAIKQLLDEKCLPYKHVQFEHYACGYVEGILVNDSESIEFGQKIQEEFDEDGILDRKIFDKCYEILYNITREIYEYAREDETDLLFSCLDYGLYYYDIIERLNKEEVLVSQ